MPIRPDLRHHYGAAFRRTVRYRALERACDRCEHCGMPGSGWTAWVVVSAEGDGRWYDEVLQVWRDRHGRVTAPVPLAATRVIAAQLTTAHLDHDPANNEPANTPALCRGCHLRHDARQHAVNAHRTRAGRKDAARPLLAGTPGRSS